MKTNLKIKEFSEIVKQDPIFLGNGTEVKSYINSARDSSINVLSMDDLITAFSVHRSDFESPEEFKKILDQLKVLIATGSSDYIYEGDIWVLYEKDGKLYEVLTFHDSISGFDWEPEEVCLEELLNRFTSGTFFNNFGEEVRFKIQEFLFE
ncbi:MAG: hypothetical protein WCT42_00020 [Candidatus Paceibacterota bacterium]